jgi:hypothetical protein
VLNYVGLASWTGLALGAPLGQLLEAERYG